MNKELLGKHIISNCIQVMRIAAEASSHANAGVQEINGSLRYFSGCQFPFFNGVFNNYQHKDAVLKDDLTEITDYFSEKNVPFIWWWLQDSEMPSEIKNELDQKGFKFLGDFTGIAVQLTQINKNTFMPDKTVKIKQVETSAEYQQFIAILCEVFQMTDSIKKEMKEMLKSYGPDGKFKHYLGFYKDKAVATATSYIDGNIVGLYNGATLTEARNKGLCSVLAKKVIDDAILLGCEYGITQLMASAMAKGIAEKLGAKKYCNLLPYIKEPNTAS